MEITFLLAIGYWNLIGSIALYLMLYPAIADKVLRQWLEVITVPYDVGKYGSLWFIWTASTNTFFSVMNILAARWTHPSQIVVICGDLFVYSVFLLFIVIFINNENYSRGLYISMFFSII